MWEDGQTHETDLVAPLRPLTSMQASRICSCVRISPTLLVAKLQLSLGLINQLHSYIDIQGSETTVSAVPRDPNRFGFPTSVPLKPGRDANLTDMYKKNMFLLKKNIFVTAYEYIDFPTAGEDICRC